MCSSALCLHISANVWLHISVKPVVYLKYPLLMNRPKRYLFVYVFSHSPQEMAKSVCFSVMKVFFSLKNSSSGIFINLQSVWNLVNKLFFFSKKSYTEAQLISVTATYQKDATLKTFIKTENMKKQRNL